jgi:putative salt-induced outer membrane protein YdiY
MFVGRFITSVAVFLSLAANLCADGATAPDRLELHGGAVLIGHIESVGHDTLRLQTDYAGTLTIDLEKIQRVAMGTPRELSLPAGLVAIKEEPAATAGQSVPSVPVDPVPTNPYPLLNGWALDGGLNLSGKSGNSDRLDVTVTVEAELERESDRLNLYGKYAYGTNNGRRSVDEKIGGGRYTNYLYDELGVFVRQELEQDDFEGISVRSTSAAGLIYEFSNDKRLRLEARTGLSYRYEDYIDDGAADFPGMDLGLDVNWQFVKWARFKGTYSYLPSIRDEDDFIIEQDSGFNFPLDDKKFWKLRFGVSSQYNSKPDLGRNKLDTRYYARLIASWQ